MLALLRQRNFALLWFGGLISFTGDWVLFVALPIYVYSLTNSVLATGLMFMVAVLPSIVLGSVAGVYVDRWDRRRTMVVANLAAAPLLLVLFAVHSAEQVWIIYLFSLAMNSIRQFARPAENALLPKLVGKEDLVTANALNSLNDNLARLIGPAVGGVVLAWWQFPAVILLDAVSFLIAGLMVAFISAPPSVTRATVAEDDEVAPSKGVLHEWLSGLRVVRSNRIVAALFLLVGVNQLAEGILNVLFVPWVKDVLHGGSIEFGWILSAQAVGGLFGGMVIGRLGKSAKPAQLVWIGFVLLGAIDLLIFNAPMLLLAVVLMALVGIPVVGLQAGIQTLFQTSVADQYRGRVMGAWATTGALLILMGQGIATFSGGDVDVVMMLSIAAGLDVVAGIVAWLALRAPSVKEEPVGLAEPNAG